jgi:hypothetical protein
MQVLVRCGQDVLVADGERWVFGRQPGAGGNVFVYVLILLGVIFSLNGVIWLLQAQWALGASLLLPGALLLAVAIWFLRARRSTRAAAKVLPIVVLDFPSGMLLGADLRPLAPLGEVEFSWTLQAFSSARALQCRWRGRSLVVLRGDAFGGGIGPAIDALKRRGLRA